MNQNKSLKIAWPVTLGIFLATNVAIANHHEEQYAGDVGPAKIE